MSTIVDLPPWLQAPLDALLVQRAHAILLDGAAGLGQYPLAMALAASWLCETPAQGRACGQCAACRAISARVHPDLCVLMPETLALELGWPLDPVTQDRLDRKEIKPSRLIRVDAVRTALAFAQTTSARGRAKVIVIYPAERMNAEAANALLKTLEEPAPPLRFVLATEAAHSLLPTIRSRCVRHVLPWPQPEQGLAWLQRLATREGLTLAGEDLTACWRLSGGRLDEALAWARLGMDAPTWHGLPARLAAGDWATVADWPLSRQLTLSMLLCHDALVLALGGTPRHFDAGSVPTPAHPSRLAALWRALQQAQRSIEHPYQAALWSAAWAERVRAAFGAGPALHSRA